jgi:hypothetical protein
LMTVGHWAVDLERKKLSHKKKPAEAGFFLFTTFVECRYH